MSNTELLRINPFDSFRQMRAMMDRAFFPWNFNMASDMPTPVENLPLDVYESNGDLVVKAALPGIKPEQVSIHITEGMLEIHAESKEEKEMKDADYYLKEYTANTWHRSLRLPDNIKADKATARYNNGFLTLTVPRQPGATPRSIEVKVHA